MRKVVVAVMMAVLCCGLALAQNPASNKAFFAAGTSTVTLAALGSTCAGSGFDAPTGSACTAWIDIFNLNDVLKTSSVGAIEAAVSLECSLWTYTTVTATSGGGKQTASSRAGVEVRVLIDGTTPAAAATPPTPSTSSRDRWTRFFMT